MSLGDFEKLFERMKVPSPRMVILKKPIRYTQDLFGLSTEQIQKSVLVVQEQSKEGDCLCLINNDHLIDVDRRDIERII